jgi:hypothetical protein
VNTLLHRLDPAEPDPELLLLGASAGGAAYAGAWMAGGLPLPPCAFRAITGLPCPTCGATHCVLALLHGHVAEAIAWNPLVFAGLVLLVLANVYAIAILAGKLPRLRFSFSAMEGRFLRLASVIILAANWAYEIHRASAISAL